MDEMRAAAQASKAWPFEEARRLLARYADGAAGEGPRAVRDRLRPLGAAAYRHLRRGGAHHDGPPRLRGDLGHPDAADLLLRRHGRDAQGPRQRAEPGDAARAPAAAADRGARPVRRSTRASARTTTRCCARFLDRFGFEYEFVSATDYYRSGRLDAVLLRAAERYDAIMEVMLASLRDERQRDLFAASCRSRRARGACSTCR